MIEIYLFLVFMIIAAIIAIEIKDLLAAAIAVGAVGFSVAILFILLQAPDLAIVQIVVEILTLIIFVAVIFRTTDIDETVDKKFTPAQIVGLVFYGFFVILFIVVMERIFNTLPPFGSPIMKVASEYIKLGLPKVGGANIVADIILDFRGLDTLGEATVLFTSVIGVLAVMRKIGRK
ncbi:MAG: hydrogen gas-evolving membrane-bound hydrogenase subunit E [candidate division WOR-3 bacterium]